MGTGHRPDSTWETEPRITPRPPSHVDLGVVLSADELHVLQRYRELRGAGQGMLLVEFAGGKPTKYEFKYAGDVRLLASLIGNSTLRD